jgi:hypothetical protein
MITREIKVGDRLRRIKCGSQIVVRELAPDGQTLWDTHGNVRCSPFLKPECWEHIDEPQADPVNHPPHYTQGEIECIDAIRAALGREGFVAYCRGNAIKYLWRCEHKGGMEDWRKADWYINRAIKEFGK